MNSTIDLKQTVENSFGVYAGMVIKDRAICDARDMLKPAARVLMYAQKIEKLTWDKPIRKSAKSVSAGMDHFYVHGDAPAYGALARLGKPFAMRYPLEDFQGNVGTMIESNDEAHYRYTNMRLAPIAKYIFDTIDKGTIDRWIDNYDNTEQYPSVLPSIGFYNIVNGTTGIAVSLASSIPQFNLREVNNAIIELINDKEVSFDKIYCVPDFATGATITNPDEVRASLEAGGGKACKMRGTIQYVSEEHLLRITEVPYGVYTSTIMQQLVELINENENYGIKRINDLTGKTPNIEIELVKGVSPTKMISKLYKDTSLEYHFGINMVMLDNGRTPRIFGWRDALQSYITHIRICKRREFEYDLAKLAARAHILDGLLIAAANIDEVVSIIKKSENPQSARTALIDRFKIDELQAKAILDMKLSRLTNLEYIKLESELKEIDIEIKRIDDILSDSTKLDAVLIAILQEVANKFGDDRRTKVMRIKDDVEADTTVEETPEKDIVILSLSNSTLKILSAETFKGSGRGRKGSVIKLPNNVTITTTLYTTDRGTLAAITNRGRVYGTPLRDLEVNNDYSLFDLFKLRDNEQVLKLIDGDQIGFNEHIVFITADGMTKKGRVSDLGNLSSKGKNILKLRENDYIIDCGFSNSENDKILIVSSSGNYTMFSITDINATGTTGIGVIGIKLGEGARVIGGGIVKDGIDYIGILGISSSGRGKITSLSEISTASRATKGPTVQKLDEEETLLASTLIRQNVNTIHLVNNGKLVSIPISQIPVQARVTLGVKLIDTNISAENIYVIQGE